MGMNKEAAVVAHRVETTLQQDGQLLLDNLPFHAGEAVEMVILLAPARAQPQHRYQLRGAPVRYDRPFAPLAQAIEDNCEQVNEMTAPPSPCLDVYNLMR